MMYNTINGNGVIIAQDTGTTILTMHLEFKKILRL